MHVFFVDSPLQLLNAVEAREHFGVPAEKTHLLLLQGASRSTGGQMNRMLPSLGWKSVHHLPIGQDRRGLVFGLRYLRTIARELAPTDSVYLGEYRSELMRHAAHAFAPQHVVVLDDGIATIAVARYRRPSASVPSGFFGSRGAKALAKRFLLGLRAGHPPHVTYFSAYEFDPGSDDRVLNDYSYLKSQMKAKRQGSSTWLLGQPLREGGFVSSSTYCTFVAAFARAASGPVVYLPHRREDPTLVDALAERTGVDVVRPDAPIEFHLCFEAPEAPIRVASFFSSALMNLHRITIGQVPLAALRIPLHLVLDPVRRSAVKSAYATLEGLPGLAMIDLPIIDLPNKET